MAPDRASYKAGSSATTNDGAQDPCISVDEADQSLSQGLNPVEAIPERKRVYRQPSRRGETEKLEWGYCCQCEQSGNIMSWPKCRHCLHNRCELCEYPEHAAAGNTGEAEKELTASQRCSKMNEFSGEIGLVLESLRSGILTLQQKNGLGKAWAGIKLLNQALSEMEELWSEKPDSATVIE
ncbi:hypothetical protein MMC13_005901 [Lambiella insularis]|nr:hypothetical protein [Lambiella insularis]